MANGGCHPYEEEKHVLALSELRRAGHKHSAAVNLAPGRDDPQHLAGAQRPLDPPLEADLINGLDICITADRAGANVTSVEQIKYTANNQTFSRA